MKTANFYLNFPGNTEEAFNFYKSIFGVEIMMLVRFADFPDSMGVSEQDRNKIAHIAIPLGAGNILMGTDVVQSHGRPFSMGSNFYISLEADTDAEAHRLFDALSEGGREIRLAGRSLRCAMDGQLHRQRAVLIGLIRPEGLRPWQARVHVRDETCNARRIARAAAFSSRQAAANS